MRESSLIGRKLFHDLRINLSLINQIKMLTISSDLRYLTVIDYLSLIEIKYRSRS